MTAYAPFGSPGMTKDDSLFEHPTIVEVAKKHGKTASQVLLAWGIQRGICMIPKTLNPARLTENY